MQVTTIGVGLAKNVLQVHRITATEHVVFNKPLRRAQFLPLFAKLEPCLIGMESCSSAHHWARELTELGLEAIYKRPRTSQPHPQHPVFPYLLRNMTLDRPNQVWCADITFMPVKNGFLYLVAIMDWATRKVLRWRLSNTMHADFCVEVV